MLTPEQKRSLVKLTVDIAVSYAGNPSCDPGKISALIKEWYEAMKGIHEDAEIRPERK